MLRKALHRLGFRYRLHNRALPGKPDLVFAGLNAVVFVNGCFWHGHDCALFKWPSSRVEFWRAKIEKNKQRDSIVGAALESLGWRRLTVWECSWIRTGHRNLELRETV
jgi:DNA mismatch endonuclease (patch repair protein)